MSNLEISEVSHGRVGALQLLEYQMVREGGQINQGLHSLPPPTAGALLEPPLVKTIPAVTAMGGPGGHQGAPGATRLLPTPK